MNKSESIVKLSAALVKFHGAMGKVGKDSVNPHFKNRYASLSNIIEAVTPHLNAAGLSVLQMPSVDGLETVLLHESGEYISSVSAISSQPNANAQQVGSAITYARRYALGAVLSLNIDEDDDANAATQKPPVQKQPPAAADNDNPWLNENTPEWTTAVDFLRNGFTDKQGVHHNGSIALLRKKFKVSTKNESKLVEEAATETP